MSTVFVDDANIIITFDPFGPDGVLVEGLLVDYQVFMSTDDGFSQMEITNLTTGSALGFTGEIDFSDPNNPFVINPTANDTFDLGGFDLQSTAAGSEIDMSFDLTVTDGDGDTSTGTIDVTVLPVESQINGNGVVNGTAADELLVGGTGADDLRGGLGSDFLFGGLGADTLRGGTLATPNDTTTDTFLYTNVNQGGDTIVGFNTGDSASGGDLIDLGDVLSGFGGASVGDAVTGGFLSFAGSNGDADTDVLVDADGGSDGFVTLATLDGLAFADAATSQATLDDNIIVD